MTGWVDHPNRRPTRLSAWDYTSAAGYFVTICLQHRENRFGEVANGIMCLNRAGEMVAATWRANAERYPDVALGAFIVMPDHVHAVVFVGADSAIREARAGLIRLVQSFKSITTLDYGCGVRAGIYPPYERVLWQRSFHDHIIRNDRDLDRVRSYIDGNPARWTECRDADPNGSRA